MGWDTGNGIAIGIFIVLALFIAFVVGIISSSNIITIDCEELGQFRSAGIVYICSPKETP